MNTRRVLAKPGAFRRNLLFYCIRAIHVTRDIICTVFPGFVKNRNTSRQVDNIGVGYLYE